MKIAASVLALASAASAFTAPQSTGRMSVALNSGMDDLKSIAEASNPVLKFYDPLNLSTTTIYDETNDATINFLRQSEIKHGRVAMAAFVGYCVQANGIHFPWATVGGGADITKTLSPPEQWDGLPDAAKWQIILFIGFLEWWSEAGGTHYMRGGVPGKFPEFNTDKIPHPVPFNLFDPFKFSANKSEEKKKAGLIKELNNGRLAMIGIFGFLAESKVEGSVPLLKGVVLPYAGEPMAPF